MTKPEIELEIRKIERKLESLKQQLAKSDQYKYGERFIEVACSARYILAQVDTETACLINLNDGNRYENPIKVQGMVLTDEEFKKVCAGDKFVRE